MIEPVKFFDNIFESTQITSTRLSNFAADCLNRLTAANSGGAYTNLINLLTDPSDAMATLLSSVDTSLNTQKGKTLSLNQVIVLFKKTMSEQEGVIANAVGGFSSQGYLQFYPKGVSEYTSATKTALPMLIDRVNTVAGNYSAQLGDPLTATLQAFETDWELNRSQQQQQKGTVETTRTESTQARADLEMALVTVVHTIGSMFPGNPDQCLAFFNFALLKRSAPKGIKEKISGEVLSGKTATAINKSFTQESSARVTNKSDNAPLFIYLAPAADSQKNGKGHEVKPGRSRYFTMDELGDINNTFLLVQNLSTVNDAGLRNGT